MKQKKEKIMAKNTRYRAANIHNALNKDKVKSIKTLRSALKGDQTVSKTQIDAAKAILELLTYFEPEGVPVPGVTQNEI